MVQCTPGLATNLPVINGHKCVPKWIEGTSDKLNPLPLVPFRDCVVDGEELPGSEWELLHPNLDLYVETYPFVLVMSWKANLWDPALGLRVSDIAPVFFQGSRVPTNRWTSGICWCCTLAWGSLILDWITNLTNQLISWRHKLFTFDVHSVFSLNKRAGKCNSLIQNDRYVSWHHQLMGVPSTRFRCHTGHLPFSIGIEKPVHFIKQWNSNSLVLVVIYLQ